MWLRLSDSGLSCGLLAPVLCPFENQNVCFALTLRAGAEESGQRFPEAMSSQQWPRLLLGDRLCSVLSRCLQSGQRHWLPLSLHCLGMANHTLPAGELA